VSAPARRAFHGLLVGLWGTAALLATFPVVALDAEQEARALRLGRYAEAAARLEAHLAATPGDGDAWQLLGDARAGRGLGGPALLAYARAEAAGTARPLALRVAIARLRARAGDREAADAIFGDVMARWRGGGVEDPHELVAVGHAARGLGRGDPSLRRTALRIYEEAMRRAPRAPAPRIALAELLLASYNNAEALPLYQEALDLDGEDPDAVMGLARSLEFDHSSGALDMARTAVALAPGRVDARVFLARALLEHEDPAGAEAAIEAALAVNPRSPRALSVLASLRDAAGDDDAVTRLMQRVLVLAPRFAEGYTLLAEAATDRRRYADAVRYAIRAVALDPMAWRAHALLGMNRLRLGDLPAARLNLETAFRGDPFNVWVKNTLDLLDGMDGYAVVSSERFRFTARPDQAEVLAPEVLAVAEQAFDALEARYGARPRLPLRIEIHPRHDDLSVRTLGLVGVDLLGVSFGPTVVVDAPMASPGGSFNWASTLWHELAHSFQFAVSQGRAPRWLAEGMAVRDEWIAREGWGSDPGPGFLQAWIEGKLAPASGLNASFLRPDSGEALGHAYVQAGLLVEMIERDHGLEALRALLAGYARGSATDELLRSVLELSPEALDARFDSYMEQRFGGALEALAPREDGPSRYARLLRSGREALEGQDPHAAEAAFLEARGLVPGHTDHGGPHHALVTLYRERGDRAAQAQALAERVAVDADDLESVQELVSVRESLGDRDGAVAALERALLIQPFDPALRERLAVLYEASGDWQQAVAQRAALVALGAVDPVAARYGLALAAHRAGDGARARRELLRTLEQAPLYEEALELLLEVRARLEETGGEPAQGARVVPGLPRSQ
jgi:tetratricopeptide (TPR) repeat protein